LSATAQLAMSPAFTALFKAYESGDYDAVARAMPTRRQGSALADDVARARAAWRKNWRRIHAVFLLDIALVAFRQQSPDRVEILNEARAFLIARPGFPGEFREDDAFEVLWHRAALGILQGSLDGGMIDQYLAQVGDRVGATPLRAGQPRLVDERLALVAAMAAELAIVPGAVRVRTITLPGASSQMTRIGASQMEITAALARIDEAAAFDVNRDEAAVRRANVLVRTNRPAEAVAALDQHKGPLKDKLVQYWRELVRGRALDLIDEPDGAAQAYTDAKTLAPAAQSPLLAMSVLRFRQGQLAEARQFTDLVKALPADADDPWGLYWYGDSRFVGDLMKAIRELAK
jgi:tetratricopeptide (TPR) repeat protein